MPKQKTPPKLLAMLFNSYKKGYGMTGADIAKAVGCDSSQNANNMIRKEAYKWNIGQLADYADALEIPYEVAFATAAEEMRQYKEYCLRIATSRRQ